MSEVSEKIDFRELAGLFDSSGWRVFERRVLAHIENESEQVIMGSSDDPAKQFALHQAIGATRAIREIMAAKMTFVEDHARRESDPAARDVPRGEVDTQQ